MPSGGAGTGSALTGLAVPDWLKNVPSLPSWSAFVHEVSPASNPPFAMTGIAWTDDVAARPSTTATIVKTVMRANVFIGRPPPVRHREAQPTRDCFIVKPRSPWSGRFERQLSGMVSTRQYDSSARELFRLLAE